MLPAFVNHVDAFQSESHIDLSPSNLFMNFLKCARDLCRRRE